MDATAPHIKRPGLLGLLAAISTAAGLAACLSLLGLAGLFTPVDGKSAGVLEKTRAVTDI